MNNLTEEQDLLLRVYNFREGLEEYDYSYLAHDIEYLQDKLEADYDKLQGDIIAYLVRQNIITSKEEGSE